MSKAAGGGGWSVQAKTEFAKEVEVEYGGMPAVISTLHGNTVRLEDGRMVTLPDFTEQVQRGVRLMDKEMPGWWQHVDTSVLDLQSENMCILGQAWSHYANWHEMPARERAPRKSNFRQFMSRMFGTDPADEERELSAEYGFNIAKEQGRLINYQLGWRKVSPAWSRAWERLTETWLTEIRKRQEAR